MSVSYAECFTQVAWWTAWSVRWNPYQPGTIFFYSITDTPVQRDLLKLSESKKVQSTTTLLKKNRTTSTSSNKSTGEDKIARRRSSNALAAKKYLERKKEEEKELDDRLNQLNSNYEHLKAFKFYLF